MNEVEQSVQSINERYRERSERFEIAFNQIHSRLKKLGRKSRNNGFVDLLHQVSARHSLVKRFFDDLKQFARLRNALVHEKMEANYYIAEPHQEVVEKIEEIADYLNSPPAAKTIASSPVVTYGVFDSLEDVLKDTEKHSFSQFPVYDGQRFTYLLTKSGLISFMANHIENGLVSLGDIKLKDVMKYQSDHNVAFAQKNVDIFTLEDIFEDHYQEGHKLEAIILTANGSKTEEPIAIVTTWDLIKIDLL